MSKIDRFYTPEAISKAMIKAAGMIEARIIADFAAGDGSLLLPASKKWDNSIFYANDICTNSLRSVKDSIDNCICTNVDFLDNEQIYNDLALKNIMGRCDLILLNPPYSYIGQFYAKINETLKISRPKSLAFIMNAIPFLSSKGKIIALMPEGAIKGERSKDTIKFIEENCCLKILDSFGSGAFKKCSARTVIISISHEKTKARYSKSYKSRFPIIRGNTSMFKIGKHDDNKIKIVHSTSLTKNGIVLSEKNGIKISYTVAAPTVLIQRVGKIQKHKVAMYTGENKISLSDCVFAIDVPSVEDGNRIVNYIHGNFDLFLQEYTGTCAQFITIERLHNFLSKIPHL